MVVLRVHHDACGYGLFDFGCEVVCIGVLHLVGVAWEMRECILWVMVACVYVCICLYESFGGGILCVTVACMYVPYISVRIF